MAQEGSLRNMCFKTRMCKYFAHGRCTRQHDCAFAHSLSEMRRAPNLACTKLCPKLAETGECHDPACAFAHERRELRKISLAGAERLPHNGRPRRQQEKDMSDLAFAAKSASAPKAHAPPPVPTPLRQGSFHTDTASTCSGGPAFISEELSSSADSSDFRSGAGSKARPRRGAKGEQLDRKPPPGRDWGARFHKTVMCTFFLKGKCNRGSDCHFAHSDAELQPMPDLSQTRLCARLVNTGSCRDPECRYAHSRGELRGTPPWLARCSRSPVAPVVGRQAEVGSEEIPSTPSSIGEDDIGVHFFPSVDAPPAAGTGVDDIPSTPSSVGEGDDALEFFPRAVLSAPQAMQLVLVAAPLLQADVGFAPPAGTGLAVAAAEAAPPTQKISVRFRDEDLPHLAVKNTFLTLEEDYQQSPQARAPRAKSMPNVFGSSRDDGDDEEACEADVSNDDPASRSPSCSSLDFVEAPLELPKEVLAPIDALQTQVVPVCAVQKVERLVEAPASIEIDLIDGPVLGR